MTVATAARRARARRIAAVALPPASTRTIGTDAVRRLTLEVDGRPYLIGPAVEGDPQTAATIDGTATITIGVRDVGGKLATILNEDMLLAGAARCTVADDVYVLLSAEPDDTGLLTITVEDEVSWRMRQFDRFLSVTRSETVTIFQFADRLVKEASAPPYAPLKFFCPELGDRVAVPSPATAGDPARGRGTGASGGYTVKGKDADGEQRQVIDAALAECARLHCSRRVMIATVMTMTQESLCRRVDHGDAAGPDSRGPYQQRAAWGPESARMDPTLSTRMFLTGGRGGQPGWKQKHGSLKTVRGSLEAAIVAVQVSSGGYAQWEGEATRTVDRWRGASSHTVSTVEPYEFTRGERKGASENSWDALGRYGEDRRIRRWAQHNTLCFVSDEELRAAAPSVEIDGTEPWLLSKPAGPWTPNQPVNEVQLRVLAQLWGIQIGATVRLADRLGALAGVFIVADETGGMVNPETTVTLRRPAPRRKEPAPTVRQDTVETSAGAASSGSLLKAARTISGQDRPYVYSGGHGGPLSKIKTHQGLDCSSSTSLALWLAGLFHGTTAITSTGFMTFGKPGKGSEFTIWANVGHVFIEFANGVSFDTRRIASTQSGPHVRSKIGPTSGFVARHIAGH